MNKSIILVLVVLASLALFSCSTLDDVMEGMETVEKISSKAPSGGSSSAMEAGTSMKGVDFRKGEVLSSWFENKSIVDNEYMPAKVMTPASDATQGQAEVLFASGEKKWVQLTVPSHKANKNELQLGQMVLFLYDYSYHEEMTEDNYRKHRWQFGRITSTDELFKGMVEIDGRSYYVKWIRVPDEPVE
ncbi:MAG: hypothetical protein SVR04_14770 [Spirochaetota bacterium]|nr:hypothetical protein [Spirochaetota bacterium]